MLNKIALEEHFATEQTLGDSQEYFFADRWEESKRRLLDIEERRLRLMDAAGIELTIVSLNAPAIQAIPEPSKRRNELTIIWRNKSKSGATVSGALPPCRFRTRTRQHQKLSAVYKISVSLELS